MPELGGLGKTESLEKWTGRGAFWGGPAPFRRAGGRVILISMENLAMWVPLGLLALYLLSGLKVVPEYQRAVLFRLGRLSGLRGPGLSWKRR